MSWGCSWRKSQEVLSMILNLKNWWISWPLLWMTFRRKLTKSSSNVRIFRPRREARTTRTSSKSSRDTLRIFRLSTKHSTKSSKMSLLRLLLLKVKPLKISSASLNTMWSTQSITNLLPSWTCSTRNMMKTFQSTSLNSRSLRKILRKLMWPIRADLVRSLACLYQ